jgi:uncharacterized protein (TIGR03083 family)
MTPAELLAALRTERAAFDAAIAVAEPDAAVPGCPGWTVADLVWHVGEVQDFWGTVVRERLVDPGAYLEPERPADWDDLVAFAHRSGDALEEALATADPAASVWTWSADQTVGWVLRRQVHEQAVHRVDAEAAAGHAHPTLDAALAADGIDEFLVHMAVDVRPDAPPLAGTVHLHCTDVAGGHGEWTVRPDGERYAVTREHAKGDAAVRGPATALLLQLWRRRPLGSDGVEVVGDADVAARFVARTDLD